MSVHTHMLRGLAALPVLVLLCIAGAAAPAPPLRCALPVAGATPASAPPLALLPPPAPGRLLARR